MPAQPCCPCRACQLMFGVKMSDGGHYSSFTLSSLRFKLLGAHVLARRADEAARVQPVVVHQLHLDLLAGVEAGEGVVEDLHVQPLLLADVVVAAGAPVLPLSNLTTAPLLPHPLCMVKTFRANTVGLQRKVSIVTRLVLLVHTVASSHYHIVAAPCELLNIWTVIRQRHGPAVIPNICFRNMRDVIKILKRRGQHMAVVDQVTQGHA